MPHVLEVGCKGDGRPLRVRAWIDILSHQVTQEELELPLLQDATGTWRASFEVPAFGCTRFFYRVAIAGEAEGSWLLRFYDPRSVVVLEDSDDLDPPKTWVAGTCESGARPGGFLQLLPGGLPLGPDAPLHGRTPRGQLGTLSSRGRVR